MRSACPEGTLPGVTDDAGALDAARYFDKLSNTPPSPEHAELLLDRTELRSGQRLLDLVCGWGELLLGAGQAAHG